MSHKHEIDRSFPRTRLYGSEKINWTLDYTEHLLERKLGGQESWNRRYAQHLANKLGMGKVKELLDWACAPDCWWHDKITQFSTIYRNRETMLNQMKKQQKEAKESRILDLNAIT